MSFCLFFSLSLFGIHIHISVNISFILFVLKPVRIVTSFYLSSVYGQECMLSSCIFSQAFYAYVPIVTRKSIIGLVLLDLRLSLYLVVSISLSIPYA